MITREMVVWGTRVDAGQQLLDEIVPQHQQSDLDTAEQPQGAGSYCRKIPGTGGVDQVTQVRRVWSQARRVIAFTVAVCLSSEIFVVGRFDYLKSGKRVSLRPSGQSIS